MTTRGGRSQISHKVNLFDLHLKYADVVSVDETLGYKHRIATTPAVNSTPST